MLSANVFVTLVMMALYKCERVYNASTIAPKGDLLTVISAPEVVNTTREEQLQAYLLSAVTLSDVERVETLLHAGAVISNSPAEEFVQIPLMVASWGNATDIVRMLLDSGADPNVRDTKFRFSALHYAAQNGNIEIAELLLNKGANIEAANIGGATPLLTAIWWDRQNFVEFLLNRGANVNARTNSGYTAPQIAGRHGSNSIARLLAARNRRN
ncbi:hypothetical protein B566_EDAN007438 [Ephemera danica]|nr:hypothetical protein B566_EDAN007438 [Ephemera danica]